ncbi:MAG TPA: hypothetical protein VFA26_01235 [Gemmataceae bacterium]|nr:hypothetical protein [Gemmataceae bacterium]
METPIETYCRIVAEQPVCEDTWFAEAWPRASAGDDAARREISGSCLRLALAVAQERWDHRDEGEFLELIQDANAALWGALDNFPGGKAEEFLRHAEQVIRQRLAPPSR